MNYLLLILAAVSFAAGGLFMKYSDGMVRLAPTVAFLMLFCIGALCQALAMKRAEMGPVYILVLGIEAIAALGLSHFVLNERLSPARLGAVALIITGIALLDRA